MTLPRMHRMSHLSHSLSHAQNVTFITLPLACTECHICHTPSRMHRMSHLSHSVACEGVSQMHAITFPRMHRMSQMYHTLSHAQNVTCHIRMHRLNVSHSVACTECHKCHILSHAQNVTLSHSVHAANVTLTRLPRMRQNVTFITFTRLSHAQNVTFTHTLACTECHMSHPCMHRHICDTLACTAHVTLTHSLSRAQRMSH